MENRKDFQKGILLAFKEPAWQKYIKIPKSEIVAYVNLMDYFNVPGRKTILNKFRKTQVENFKKKQKASYSYILTFQLLQDLRRAKKIKDLFRIWGLSENDKLRASKLLAGLLKEQAEKQKGIQGAFALPLFDVFQFFNAPSVSTEFWDKIFNIGIGKLASGISLFLTPTTLNPQDDKEIIDDVFDKMFKQSKTQTPIPPEQEEKQDKKEDKKNKTKETLKKGVPFGAGLAAGGILSSFRVLVPLVVAYLAFDMLDDKK